jgi:hypothetical protein
MTTHRPRRSIFLLLVLLTGLATPALLLAQSPNPGRDRRNDNDRQQRQRHDEREFMMQVLLYQQLLQQQYAAQYLTTLQAMESWRMANTGQFPPPGRPRPPEAVGAGEAKGLPRSTSAGFRSAPGERELELARLWKQVDAAKARALYDQAVQRAGEGSDVAELARRELKTLPMK